jgi:hypothetical protein
MYFRKTENTWHTVPRLLIRSQSRELFLGPSWEITPSRWGFPFLPSPTVRLGSLGCGWKAVTFEATTTPEIVSALSADAFFPMTTSPRAGDMSSEAALANLTALAGADKKWEDFGITWHDFSILSATDDCFCWRQEDLDWDLDDVHRRLRWLNGLLRLADLAAWRRFLTGLLLLPPSRLPDRDTIPLDLIRVYSL